jgi:hypothetical protein
MVVYRLAVDRLPTNRLPRTVSGLVMVRRLSKRSGASGASRVERNVHLSMTVQATKVT